MTAEQLEASRAERMRLNGPGALTFEDARTWLEETGLCLFLPRKQHAAGLAPSFVEAVAGQRNPNPDAKHVALAEELLVRLEKADVAVRLNLLGQPGEQPDFVVAAWVLPYVYALRGDRDWRRTPQLTGSRQVSPLAVQAYKLLEAGEATIPQLKHTLGREVSEAAVLRAITELWQQLRIIPLTEAPGKAPRWQLLRVRFQKAIAEGASTSQVTAISVLASIYLQAVIAGTMEDVELFLAPLTARSKVREVLRGLVATRQVHSISLGHAPHFYVAGTLPEFTPAPTIYTSSTMGASSYFLHAYERDEESFASRSDAKHGSRIGPGVGQGIGSGIESRPSSGEPHTPAAYKPAEHKSAEYKPAEYKPAEPAHSHRPAAARKPAPKPAARPHFSRPAVQARDRKPAQSGNGRPARHAQAEARGPRWASNAAKHTNHSANGTPARRGHANGAAHPSAGSSSSRSAKPGSVSRSKHAIAKAKPGSAARNGVATRNGASHSSRPRTVSAGVKSGGKRYGMSAQRSKKRG